MAFEKQLARILKIDEACLGGNVAEEHCKLVNQFLKSAATMLSVRNSEIQSPHFEPREVFSGDETIDKELKARLRSKFEKSFFRTKLYAAIFASQSFQNPTRSLQLIWSFMNL